MKHNLIYIVFVSSFWLFHPSKLSASAAQQVPMPSETVAESVSPYKFTVTPSADPHGDEPFCIHLRNGTGGAVDDLRILFASKIDESQPFTPGNVSQAIWQFVPAAIKVSLPLSHKQFCMAVFRGLFDEDAMHALDVIRGGEASIMFVVDGESISGNVRSVELFLDKS